MNLESHIKTLNGVLKSYQFGQEPDELYEPIRYILELGGKRIRPMLVLLAAKIYGADPQKLLVPACSVEVFHNFTLMHDDIMDEAPLRRGKDTVHKKWNENLAILSGDVMLVKAYDMLLESEVSDFKTLLALFNKCAREVCEGQQYDMNFEDREDVSVDEYLEMIRLKTAVLLGFSLRMGGYLAGAPVSEQEKLDKIGELAGIGFQLKDDLLDVFGDPEKVGKQVGGDIIADKKTYLQISALNSSKANDIRSWFGERDKQEKVEAVTGIYNELGLKEQSEALIQSYFDESFKLLDELEGDASSKKELIALFKFLIDRES